MFRDVLLQQGRADYAPMLDLSAPYHRAYAERHGLEYVRVDGAQLPDWTGHWDSIPLFIGLIEQGADRVFWLDADTLIVGDEDVREGLSGHPLTMARHPGEGGHWNCGVFFIEASGRVWEFFNEVLRRGPGYYPWYQQRIMNELLDRPEWSGMVGVLDNRWNSTVRHVEAPNPVIMAWHGTPGARGKHDHMLEYIERHMQ